MIVLDIRTDNFYSFKDFHMNMSYPKKTVNSYIPDEYLMERPNFRYKKINILLGANASGKTSVGKMLMDIFNFIYKKQYTTIVQKINNPKKEAYFSMDFITSGFKMYRINAIFSPLRVEKYTAENVRVCIREVPITLKDSYETCAEKISNQKCSYDNNFVQELEKVTDLSWLFEYLSDSSIVNTNLNQNVDLYIRVLQNILHTLDPSIKKVEKIAQVENTFVIRMKNKDIVMQDGEVINKDILSSGTKEGIAIASVLTSILGRECSFYYCDEKFSHINSDVKKAILTVMINSIRQNEQLFFTTHKLAVYEKAELDTYTKEELKSRIPNAVRYQNKYVQRPAATLIVLKNKIVPYLNKLKRRKNGLYIKYQKIFQEIFEKIDGREAKLTGKLSDSYILGYYHQKESFYQKQEEDAEKPEAIAI